MDRSSLATMVMHDMLEARSLPRRRRSFRLIRFGRFGLFGEIDIAKAAIARAFFAESEKSGRFFGVAFEAVGTFGLFTDSIETILC